MLWYSHTVVRSTDGQHRPIRLSKAEYGGDLATDQVNFLCCGPRTRGELAR